MIDCGCKGKTRHYVPLGDEAVKICIDCAEKIYKATIEGSIKHIVKGGAESGLLRKVDDNSKALQGQT